MRAAPDAILDSVVTFGRPLRAFIEDEVLPGLSLNRARFWRGFEDIVNAFTPVNAALLLERDRLQGLIRARQSRLGGTSSVGDEIRFLREIGYLHPRPRPFQIETANVDHELCSMAAPQVIAPIDNARAALNAANARWGSLRDTLYGSDVIRCRKLEGCYDVVRGDHVAAWLETFLDQTFPLEGGSHAEVSRYGVEGGQLTTDRGRLRSPWQFAGRSGAADAPRGILLRNHGLHLELKIEPDHPLGRRHRAGLADVVLESAASAILDFDDGVVAVDAEDKIALYRSWLRLMAGALGAPDRTYRGSNGAPLVLKGRSLMIARTVGMLMNTPLVRVDGRQAPEGIIDAVLIALIALHDVRGLRRNSVAGSIYLVMPKLHGPHEAAFTARLLDAVEDLLELDRHTIKIGLMDEERRTGLNLMAVIAPLRRRIVLISTGLANRTGDEIHTAMALGPVVRKSEINAGAWRTAYEAVNVDTGLACGFPGRGQIGKGMSPRPDPLSGASTTWAPSPAAATLHALHYHRVAVAARQSELIDRDTETSALFSFPIADRSRLNDADITAELDGNLQDVLGYAARWVGEGVGCSKAPGPDGTSLMTDRASCRVSSQILANWLLHGVLTAERVTEALDRMAPVVDERNASDPAYVPLGKDPRSSHAFRAARDLVLTGAIEPGGYPDRVLRAARLQHKAGAP
ncbi:MAG: malate synthase [Caulobacteraceae bacterium]|nr:malate synthase [Caulobacteraceae bacterium]